MKKIIPFKNIDEAISMLDNGGRFYNILTKADDGIITKAELGKVAGVFNSKQQMILFFYLSISNLDEHKKKSVISKLGTDLQMIYTKYKPVELSPLEANTQGVIASNTIISGIPKLKESKSDFKGFIMIPISTGSSTTFAMIPIIDVYDVYELRDEHTDTNFIIAHAKGKNKLPEKKIKVAGVLKELKSDKKEKVASQKYLEAIYQVDVSNI